MEKILELLNDATYVVTYGRNLAEIELYINPNNGNTKVFLYPEKLTNDNKCGDNDFDEIEKIIITSGLDRFGKKFIHAYAGVNFINDRAHLCFCTEELKDYFLRLSNN